MSDLLAVTLLVPFFSAALGLLGRGRPGIQRTIALTGAALHLALAVLLLHTVRQDGIQVLSVGDWPAPFGIVLVADLLSALMVLLTATIGLATMAYSMATVDRGREAFGYYPLTSVLIFGVTGAFLTGDLFNLYVWFEVLLISSFVLMALGGHRPQIEGAFKYVVLNLLASVLFLTALGVLYALVGTLNMADVAQRLPDVEPAGLALVVTLLFTVAFAIKAGAFPLFAWLPSSYHTPPVATSALFAGLLTKVGVYALVRLYALNPLAPGSFSQGLLLAFAGASMVVGVFGALSQHDFRRVLSFHIISQIGYMVMGLALFTPLAIAGVVFYLAHHILVKANLFLVSGLAQHYGGSFELKRLGGLARSRPLLAVAFLVPALALAGIPPLSGFWAKLILIRAGLEIGAFTIVAIALFAGLLTLLSMAKVWNAAFWKDAPADQRRPAHTAAPTAWVPVLLLAGVTVAIGLYAQPLLDLALDAAAQLTDTSEYVAAVLGGGSP